jgi:uncharacterized protein YgiM (DUF1202 family)
MKPSLGDRRKLVVLLALLLLCNACALIRPQPPPAVYYTIPSVTYFRESPGYASRNIATVYRGEPVTILSKIAHDWCQVQTTQGQQVGWIQCPLLSPVPIPTETYTVQEDEVPLRDTPQKDGTSRQVLRRGDIIRKVSENQQGWWWVLMEKSDSLGWIPATALLQAAPATVGSGQAVGPAGREAAEAKASGPPASPVYLYAATASLDLRLLPLLSSQVVKVLKFNDKVEKVAQSGAEWLKVKYPETGAQGWVLAQALAESPLAAPKVFPPKPKKSLRKPGRVRTAEPEATESEEIEPEVM